MPFLVNKKILWIGVGAAEYYEIYHTQICDTYSHHIIEEFSIKDYDYKQYHCCFVFSGIVDADLYFLSDNKSDNTVLCFNDHSLLKYRKTEQVTISLLFKSGFCIFSNDLFAEFCVKFSLFSYQLSSLELSLPLTLPKNIINDITNSVKEIRCWMKHFNVAISSPSTGVKCGELATTIDHLNSADLLTEYTYISCVTESHVIQIFYPKGNLESFYRPFYGAMLRRVGSAKTVSISNHYRILRDILSEYRSMLVYTSTVSKECHFESIYYLIKDRT